MNPVYSLNPKKYDCIVLLSTLNGEKYLREQLDSLASQSFTSFQVLVRDDGSTDSTLEILKTYKETLKMVILDNCSHLGLFLSYSLLLKHARLFKYVALCDQDDIWDQNKILHSITELKRSRALLLVHRHEILIDGRLVEPSVKQALGNESFSYVATRNIYPGNTFVFRGELLNYFDYKINAPHDWQLILRALALESVVFSGATLSKYRIHDTNAIGVRFGFRHPWKIILNAADIYKWRYVFSQSRNSLFTKIEYCGQTGRLAQMILKEKEMGAFVKLNLLMRLLIQSFSYRLVNTSLFKKSSLN
jgi:rhamnosyltransferase